jgi:hypothetical protein
MVMPMGGFGMNSMYSGNVYENMKARYGYPPVDLNERPRVAGYPRETIPQGEDLRISQTKFGRFMHKLFG